jgi:hypothetical protein
VSDLWKIERPGARLVAALDSNVLLRGQWTDGHERACALAWMSREVLDAESAGACPASLMPQWAAEVIPWMDDAPSAEAWPGLMRRLGLLIDRATPQTWSRRLQAKWCQIAVVEALQHTTDAAVVEVCERVIVLLDRAIAGAEPSADEWAKAKTAAEAAAWAAAAWAVEAAEAAVEAAWAVEAAEAAAWAAADRIAAGMLDALEKEIALNALEEPAK